MKPNPDFSPALLRMKLPTPRKVTVKQVTDLSPRMRRVTFVSDQFDGIESPLPGAHIKLFFVAEDFDWTTMDIATIRSSAPGRTYTPRALRPESGEVDVDFMLHGDGVAANWVANAAPGQHLVFAGPRGGFSPEETADKFVLVADETAIPAASMILEEAGNDRILKIILEVEDRQEERPLTDRVVHHPLWLHRSTAGNTAPGDKLIGEVCRAAEEHPDAFWWVACESSIMRRIRETLLARYEIAPEKMLTRGYWLRQRVDYPDNDYGDNAAKGHGSLAPHRRAYPNDKTDG
tara:strand:- start:2337 stop:3209 length:873 start_codon:yes stop_codon:yes gene_type:complete